jgi:hypothetical protein
MLAAAVWSLEASGHLCIAWDDDADLWLEGRRQRGSTVPQEGLEARLLHLVPSEGSSLVDVVIRGGLNNGGEYLALNGIVALAQEEAIAQGVLHGVERTRRLPRCLIWSDRLPDFVVDPAMSEELEEAFSAFDGRISQWVEAHPEDWGRLLSDCGKALYKARRPVQLPSGGP